MERKDFLQKFAVGGSILLVSPMLFNACKDEEEGPEGTTINLSDPAFAALQEVGGFAYAGDIIVIRTGENTYVALSKICTHEKCTVGYNPSTNQLSCPCHGSVYAISGEVINGTAPNSLHV
ncbi:MAG: ubiquinol-cytochrome c reductase iron-sulfur subunit [Mariniphaga sp.]